MTTETMKPGSLADVASAQAIVLDNLVNGQKPDDDLVKAAGLEGHVTASMYDTPYKPNALLRFFLPGTARKRVLDDRQKRTTPLDKHIVAALTAAQKAERAKPTERVTRASDMPLRDTVEVRAVAPEALELAVSSIRDITRDTAAAALKTSEAVNALHRDLAHRVSAVSAVADEVRRMGEQGWVDPADAALLALRAEQEAERTER